jgi:hypothetical protein
LVGGAPLLPAHGPPLNATDPLRRIALNLARADTALKASLKGKRKYAGWDDAFMATLMAG